METEKDIQTPPSAKYLYLDYIDNLDRIHDDINYNRLLNAAINYNTRKSTPISNKDIPKAISLIDKLRIYYQHIITDALSISEDHTYSKETKKNTGVP